MPSAAKGTACTLIWSRPAWKPTAALIVSSSPAVTAVGTLSLTWTEMAWLVIVPGVFSICERTRLTPFLVASEVLL